jgi:hypothetical protein
MCHYLGNSAEKHFNFRISKQLIKSKNKGYTCDLPREKCVGFMGKV